MAKPTYFQGQKFHNPNDPSAPVLMYYKGNFLSETDYDKLAKAPEDKVDANMLGRVKVGLDPMLRAENVLSSFGTDRNVLTEKYGIPNFLSDVANAEVQLPFVKISDFHPFKGLAPLAGKIDPDFAKYRAGVNTYKAFFAPTQAGASQTGSEIQNVLKGSLPLEEDTADVRAFKQDTRKSVLNAFAGMAGRDMPFPEVPPWTPAAARKTSSAAASKASSTSGVKYLGEEKSKEDKRGRP